MKSIRSKMIAIMMVSLLVLGSVFVGFAWSSNRESRRGLLDNVARRLMYESETVNKTIRGLEQSAVDLALSGQTAYLTRDRVDNAFRDRTVLRHFEQIPNAVGGGIWYERFAFDPARERYCVYVCRDRERNLALQEEFDGVEYDYPEQMWYRQIKAQLDAGEPVGWSETYFDELGTRALMTTVGAAIYDAKGRFAGMSTLDWQIQKMVNQLSALAPTAGSFVVLIDLRFGKVVADTRQRRDDAAPRIESVKIGRLEWLAALPELSRDQITTGDIELNGTNYLAFGRQLDNGMLIWVQVPERELMGFIDRRNVLALTGAVCLVAAVLAFALYFLTVRVNRPLRKLMNGVEALGRGELDTEFEVRGRDEIAMLGMTFNRMRGELKNYIGNLRAVTAAKEKIESELKVAQEIQKGILPEVLPPFPKCEFFEVDAFLAPAREVGGDLYDFFLLSSDRVCLVIGDVSDKGVPASLFMAVTQTLHRGLAHDGVVSPGELVAKMNQALCNNNTAGMFVTYIFAVLDLQSGVMTYCNAGHNPFLLLKQDGRVLSPCRRHGIPLGLRSERSYGETELTVEAGDMLFFYTDGVPESKNAADEFFGMERLRNLLAEAAARRLSPAETNRLLRTRLAEFVGEAEQFDDVTVVAVKVTSLRQ